LEKLSLIVVLLHFTAFVQLIVYFIDRLWQGRSNLKIAEESCMLKQGASPLERSSLHTDSVAVHEDLSKGADR